MVKTGSVLKNSSVQGLVPRWDHMLRNSLSMLRRTMECLLITTSSSWERTPRNWHHSIQSSKLMIPNQEEEEMPRKNWRVLMKHLDTLSLPRNFLSLTSLVMMLPIYKYPNWKLLTRLSILRKKIWELRKSNPNKDAAAPLIVKTLLKLPTA